MNTPLKPFKAALTLLNQATKRPSWDVLENVHLSSSGHGTITLARTNLALYTVLTVPYTGGPLDVLVNARELADAIKNVKSDFQLEYANTRLTVEAAGARYTLATESPEDFPPPPVPGELALTVTPETLATLRRVALSCGTDDARPALMSVWVGSGKTDGKTPGDYVRAIAADGFVLSTAQLPDHRTVTPILLPAILLQFLGKAKAGTVDFYVTENARGPLEPVLLAAVFDGGRVYAYDVTQSFPDTDAVTDSLANTPVTCSAAVDVAELRDILAAAPKGRLLVMFSGVVGLVVEDADGDHPAIFSTGLPTAEYRGEALAARYNRDLLLKVLANFPGETVCFDVYSKDRPLFLRDDGGRLSVIMPMLVE